jgi:hypothetical protein
MLKIEEKLRKSEVVGDVREGRCAFGGVKFVHAGRVPERYAFQLLFMGN